MKHLFLVLLFATSTIVNAQSTKESQNDQQLREPDRVSPRNTQQFINAEEIEKELMISQPESEKVWAIYTEYKSARKSLLEKKRERMKSNKAGNQKMTDKDYEMVQRSSFDAQRERINLDEAYYNQFLEILPASKVHQLMKPERHNKKKPQNSEYKPEQNRTNIRAVE